ncbi:ribosomal RNA small subunit methyltransferase A [Candidatus Dependentiae bacterium]|nr:ribosomal RNA small subunit methyltransferase A [Candidatus Dependentiae bacterium]
MKNARKNHSQHKHSHKNHSRSYHAEPRKKKEHGQVFLRDQSIVEDMLKDAQVQSNHTVVEIGCGDGFLTSSLLCYTPCKKLVVFEIDEEWARVVKEKCTSPKLDLNVINFLDVDLTQFFSPADPVVLLANLPYHITFPIFHVLKKNADLFSHGVVMVQEEVAQRLVATHGRSAGAISHYFQHYFELKLLTKVPPTAFDPQPQIFSRLVSFRPKKEICAIPDEEQFWEFVKTCFRNPRQMLHNNLHGTAFGHIPLTPETTNLRAQQMNMDLFLALWSGR